MRALYESLQDHIYNVMPEIKWIDLWNNQLNNLDQEDPIPFPAAFIEFTPIAWTRMIGCKKAELIIRIHLVQESYASSYKGSATQSQALEILDNSDILDTLLEDYSGQNCTPMIGSNMEIDVNHDMLIDTILDFTTSYTKVIAKKKVRLEVTPAIKFKATIKV